MIETICSCGERYEVKDDLAGKRVRCLACSGEIGVPAARSRGGQRRAVAAATTVSVGSAATATATVDPAAPRRSPRKPLAAIVPPTTPARPARPVPTRSYVAPTARREAFRDWSIAIGAATGYAAIVALWLLL